ncbi:flippase [Tellurirhabdus bombi]|uniref:flippase n=1 Tax=Tellurirhabdus bombi TaxID=2907205 RepID=UPI001F22DB15|nr:flippase [Tellurirhabdus bombi]
MIDATPRKLSQNTAKALINAGWVFFDRIFRMAAGMLIGVWLARYLGPEQFGQLNYATVFPAILLPVASLGLATVLVTELITKKLASTDELLSTAFFLRLLAGLVSFLAIGVAAYLFYGDQPTLVYMILFSASTLVFQSADVIDLFFQAEVQARRSVLAKSVVFLFSTLLRAYLLIVQADLLAFSALILFDAGLTALSLFVFYGRYRSESFLHWRFNARLAQQLFQAAWPLMISDFFIFIYMRADQFMLESLASSAELGRYSAALRLSEVWYFIAAALVSSFYPSILQLREKDEAAFLKGYQQLLSLLAFISIGIAVGTLFFADMLVDLLFGNQYEGVAQILIVHIWAGVFVFLGVGTSNWFVLYGRQRFMLYKTIAGAGVNVALNGILIPKYGAVGASVATLLAYMLSAYLLNYFSKDSRIIFRMQSIAILDAFRLRALRDALQRFNY